MTAASKNGRQGTKKNPVTPSRDEIIEAVRQLGGAPEVKRYEDIEALEKTHGQRDVQHRWQVGDILGMSCKDHEELAIRIYSAGLQRSPQTLRLSVRFAELYKRPQIQKMLAVALKAGHELNWAHFRQLLREGLTDVQRADLVTSIVTGRWGYRELEDVITWMLGGKKSKGGRKPGKMKYKTYAGALKAMKMRSKAWLALEEDWVEQVKTLAAKLSEDEKHTPEFLANTTAAAQQLRDLADKAQKDADAAEAIVAEVSRAMGSPELKLQAAVQVIAQSIPDAFPASDSTSKSRAAHKAHGKGKPHAKPKTGKRPRLAKHPKMANGKLASAN